MKSNSFKQQVIDAVNSIPEGKVTNYGTVAFLAESPRAARQVGWILAGLGPMSRQVPWWRVVNKSGYISIRGHAHDIKDVQRDLLMQEGVEVDAEYKIDMQKFGWEV